MVVDKKDEYGAGEIFSIEGDHRLSLSHELMPKNKVYVNGCHIADEKDEKDVIVTLFLKSEGSRNWISKILRVDLKKEEMGFQEPSRNVIEVRTLKGNLILEFETPLDKPDNTKAMEFMAFWQTKRPPARR